MPKRKAQKAAHNKAACFSLSLPEWYRALLPAVDPKSNSRALRILVNYALEHGAANHILGLPAGIDGNAIISTILAGTTPAQQVGGYRAMLNHAQVHGDPTTWAQQADDPEELTDAELRDLGIDPATMKPFQHQQPAQPIQQAHPAQVAAPAHKATSTVAETEALMLELQQGFGAPPH